MMRKTNNNLESTKTDRNRTYFQYYVVAVVDVLGQKVALSKLTAVPKSKQEEEVFLNRAKQSIGRVEQIRRSFQSFYTASNDDKRRISVPLTSDQEKRFRALRHNEVKFQFFSDTLLSFSALGEYGGLIAVNGVSTIFSACISMMLHSLAREIPLRGGIEVSTALEMRNGDIYGHALNVAYNLENKKAEHMRIVIGPELINYLDAMSKIEAVDDEKVIMKGMSRRCQELITKDVDNSFILDYMGEAAMNLFGTGPILDDLKTDLLPRIPIFLNKELAALKTLRLTEPSDECEKLIIRYQKTLYYYDSRINIWK